MLYTIRLYLRYFCNSIVFYLRFKPADQHLAGNDCLAFVSVFFIFYL